MRIQLEADSRHTGLPLVDRDPSDRDFVRRPTLEDSIQRDAIAEANTRFFDNRLVKRQAIPPGPVGLPADLFDRQLLPVEKLPAIGELGRHANRHRAQLAVTNRERHAIENFDRARRQLGLDRRFVADHAVVTRDADRQVL